jgi:hypothetical protein
VVLPNVQPKDASVTLPPERPSLDVLLDRALQTGGETDGFDFKEQLDFRNNAEHKIKLLKAIGAFGNTDNGGHVIIGVSNDRRIVGLTPELVATFDQTPVQRMAGRVLRSSSRHPSAAA